jgi:hypothetical protein
MDPTADAFSPAANPSMGIKIVFLHAGLHKTATSSLQATCKANRARLREQGVRYPLFHCVENGRRGIDNHSIPLRTIFNSSGKSYHISELWRLRDVPAVAAGYRQALEEEIAQHARLLLSGEDVCSMAIADLRNLRAFLEGAGVEIVPLACVRSPYSHHCSAIQHALRRAVKGRGPRVALTRFKSQLPKVEALLDVFGDAVRFLPFRQACADPLGPVAAVLRQFGLDPEPLQLVRSNEGCSNDHFRQVWQELDAEAAQSWTADVREDKLRLLRTANGGAKFALTSTEVDAIRERLDAENEAFERLLGNVFCDQGYPTVD